MDTNEFASGSIWAMDPQAFICLANGLKSYHQSHRLPEYSAKAISSKKPGSKMIVKNGIAILPIFGTIQTRAGLFSLLFGGASIDRIRADLEAAAADPKVKGIVLDIDSPGGSIKGVSGLAESIFRIRDKKPVVSYSAGQMTSAGTWIGSAASEKILSPTALDGSIGVIAVHADYSGRDAQMGITYSYITAGRYKAVGNSHEPLSDDTRQYIQGHLDYVYDVFISAVAKYRGFDVETARKQVGDGRIFIGQAAVDAGLADRLGSLEDAIAAAAGQTPLVGAKKRTAAATATSVNPSGGANARPDPIRNIQRKENIMFENEVAKHLKEHSGTLSDAILKVAAARPDLHKDYVTRFQTGKIASQQRKEAATFENEVSKHQAQHQCNRSEAIRAVAASSPELHQDYLRRANSGQKTKTLAAPPAADQAESFEALVKAWRKHNKCSQTEALKGASAARPDLHKQYLSRKNAGRV